MVNFLKAGKTKLSVTVLGLSMLTLGFSSFGFSGVSYAAPAYSATCRISGVPSTLREGSVINLKLTVTNTGSAAIAPYMITVVKLNQSSTSLKERYMGKILPGQSASALTSNYIVSSNSKSQGEVVSHSDLNYASTKVYFKCTKTFSVQ